MTFSARTNIGIATATLLAGYLPLAAQAQAEQSAAQPTAQAAWQQCAAQTEDGARLACFDQWAKAQPAIDATSPAVATQQATSTGNAASASTTPATPATQTTAQLGLPADLGADSPLPVVNGGCRDATFTEMSRFWELEEGTDCGNFSFRGYRPVTLMYSAGNTVNRQPTSGNPVNSATSPTDYDKQEMRIQLSVRTKLASGLLTRADSKLRDSLWVGYTSQSSWQLFNSEISRPFRNTDHEPEIFYVYPTTAQLPFGWKWRYTGIGLVHQSNGQSDPLSRSWNRYYAMTGFELDNRWSVNAKFWKRISETAEKDNNPDIQNYIGRAELKVGWHVNPSNWLGVTARGSLNGSGKGSGRVEWMHTLGHGWMGGKSNLRLHAMVFSGYGDSLIDYNFKRTVLSVGFSLLDF